MSDNIKALRGYIKDRVLYGDSAFFATEDAESCADEIGRLRAALRKIKRCAYVDWTNSIYIKGKDDLHIREFIAGVLGEKE